MNISIINIKDLRKFIYFILIIVIIYFGFKIALVKILNLGRLIKFEHCIKFHSSILKTKEETNTVKNINVISFNLPILALAKKETIPKETYTDKKNDDNFAEIIISENATTQAVAEKNIEESYNYTYGSIKIKNQSNYNLQEQNLNTSGVELHNKKIIIYHTHTCESYTPSERYNYTMTGNYRTTDNNYNVVRVGSELEKNLQKLGFTVIHDKTYHDYPSYNGSYDRSFETVSKIIEENPDVSMVIDIHRDAVGDGSWYGPTVLVDGKSAAQMMLVMRNRWRRINSSKLERKFRDGN